MITRQSFADVLVQHLHFIGFWRIYFPDCRVRANLSSYLGVGQYYDQ